MVSEVQSSTPRDAGSDKDVDGRPSVAMTRRGRTVKTLGLWYNLTEKSGRFGGFLSHWKNQAGYQALDFSTIEVS